MSDEDAYREYDRRKKYQRIIVGTNFLETGITMTVRYISGAGLQINKYFRSELCASVTQTVEASRDKILQRFGRVGRKFSGEAFPFFTRVNFFARPEFSKPEITRSSLDRVLMTIIRCGIDDLSTLRIFGIDYGDPLQVNEIYRSQRQLLSMGAIDQRGRPTLRGLLMDDMKTETINIASMLVWGERFGYAAEITTLAAAVHVVSEGSRIFENSSAGLAGKERFRRSCIDDLELYLKLFCGYSTHLAQGERSLRGFLAEFGLVPQTMAEIHETRKAMIKDMEKNVHTSQLKRALDLKRIFRIRGAVARAMKEWIFIRSENGGFEPAFPELCPLKQKLEIDWNSAVYAAEDVKSFVCLDRVIKDNSVFATNIVQLDPNWIPDLEEGQEGEFFARMSRDSFDPVFGAAASEKRILDSPLTLKDSANYEAGKTYQFTALHFQKSREESNPHHYFVRDELDAGHLVIGMSSADVQSGESFKAVVKEYNHDQRHCRIANRLFLLGRMMNSYPTTSRSWNPGWLSKYGRDRWTKDVYKSSCLILRQANDLCFSPWHAQAWKRCNLRWKLPAL